MDIITLSPRAAATPVPVRAAERRPVSPLPFTIGAVRAAAALAGAELSLAVRSIGASDPIDLEPAVLRPAC